MTTLLLFYSKATLASEIEESNEEKESIFNECSDQYSALIVHEKNNEVLYSKRADQIIYPASLVKLMTLYLTFEAIELKQISPDDTIEASKRAQEVSEVNKINTLHLVAADTITVRQAIRALIVKSFNEAAVMLAEKISGNEWNFVRKMNQKAAELGMINSSFKNSSGLHEPGQYTTAYDLARLARSIKKDFPEYYHLFSLKEFTYNDITYPTHNHVLVDYQGAEGMKTGFTRASGFNLVTSAKKGNERVISILTSCASYEMRDQFMVQLLDHSFTRIKEDKENFSKLKNGFKYDESISNNIRDYESQMRFDMTI
ncbi:MAG: D-alanyl-D-alanine carboxypeptidase [Rickettsiales bacterium]|nr:D-alanyl-D-alanine carboxypeptidase [Rickettsiales bacterium]